MIHHYAQNELKLADWDVLPRHEYKKITQLVSKDQWWSLSEEEIPKNSTLYIVKDIKNITYLIWFKETKIIRNVSPCFDHDFKMTDTQYEYMCFKFITLNNERNEVSFHTTSQAEILNLQTF